MHMLRRNPPYAAYSFVCKPPFFQVAGEAFAEPIGFDNFVRFTPPRVAGVRPSRDVAAVYFNLAAASPEGRAAYHGTLTDEFTRSGNG